MWRGVGEREGVIGWGDAAEPHLAAWLPRANSGEQSSPSTCQRDGEGTSAPAPLPPTGPWMTEERGVRPSGHEPPTRLSDRAAGLSCPGSQGNRVLTHGVPGSSANPSAPLLWASVSLFPTHFLRRVLSIHTGFPPQIHPLLQSKFKSFAKG